MKKIPLTCGCGRPWAYIANGHLFVVSRHGGKEHLNSIALTVLLPLLGLSMDDLAALSERQAGDLVSNGSASNIA